jgi:CRISPR-associated protein Csm4
MKTYGLKVEPLAPWATPWHADTLFSALAWQVRKRAGETSIRRLIDAFSEGSVPFVLSDAFPEGWLPCPLSTILQPLADSNVKPKLPAWVSENQFRTLIRNPYPLLTQSSWPSPIASSHTLHASIDRCLGTTSGEGNLFEVDSLHLHRGDPAFGRHLVVYIRTGEWLGRVVDLFQSLSSEGFGKRKSVGRGAFRLVGDPEACEWMDVPEGADGYVSLSHFIPASGDPADGRWSLVTKYPKFSPGTPANSPFKGRVLMLRPGSAFRTSGPILPFYGRIVKGIWPGFPAAIQYGLAFPVPIRWPSSVQNPNAS